MSRYTTGELAKLCGVSVRTVQFYDAKDLLKPSELTEGGRRLYSESDVNQLRLICMLKSLGLSLTSIKEILQSSAPNKVLLLLLDEQSKQLKKDLEKIQNQLLAIQTIQDSITDASNLPLDSVPDIEQLMKSKSKLRKTHAIMLIIGILMDIIQLATILLWIMKGIWIPFVICLPIVILSGILMTWIYFKNTDYICPECNTQFKPKLQKFLFSKHTPKTRKLTCPSCHYQGYCVEVASKK